MPKLLALDGNSLLHRAFHALPLLTNSEGVYTNAVYGFLNMFFKLLEEEKPDYLAVAFDIGRPAVRLLEYADYKGQRPPTASELKGQFGLLKEILNAMRVEILEEEGYEADDLLGSLIKAAEREGFTAVVVSGDRDLLQLVSKNVTVKLCRKGIAEMEAFTPAAVQEKYSLMPEQIPDLKGLMGDSSDNIPGVPGVGEKTAVKLLKEYPSVEEVLSHIPEVSGKKLKQSLTEHGALALLSKKLATIILDRPVSLADCAVQDYDLPRLKELFSRLEFKSLLKKLASWEPAAEVPVITDKAELAAIVEEIKAAGELAFLLGLSKADDMQAELVDFSLSWQGRTVSLLPEALELFKPVFTAENIVKYTHDLKSQLLFLWRQGIYPARVAFDTMLAAYLLDPAESMPDLGSLAEENMLSSRGAGAVMELKPILQAELESQGMSELFAALEMPLAPVLAKMEFAGIALDTSYLAELSGVLDSRLQELAERIYFLAGERFNINSPKQLGVILFERLGLPAGKKTKTGYSTNADVLEFLRDKHLIVEEILAYRQLAKLKSTYADALPKLINRDTGRLHTSLNQALTATGRLSSSNPNLQNIPVRGDLGKKIRQAFIVGREDAVLLSADYSQIELRILAHISGDENLCRAFKEEEDIHTKTAAEVFGVPVAEVDSELRSKAKAVNFGIVYGISDFGLAKNIQVPVKEAKLYIENYLQRYPKVKAYMENIVALGKEQGFVTTIMQRRRYLPDLHNKNHIKRSFAGRAAINTPIQGSAADIIKLAMLRIDEELLARGLRSRMLLQVHDELILEVPLSELEEVKALVAEKMSTAADLSVPLTVGTSVGSSWAELKD